MTLRELLTPYGIIGPAALMRILGCSRQLAHAYLIGKSRMSDQARLILHREKGIPLELLLCVTQPSRIKASP